MMETIIRCDLKGVSIRLVQVSDWIYIVVITLPEETTVEHLRKANDRRQAYFPKRNRKKGIYLPQEMTYDQAHKRFFQLIKQAQNEKIKFYGYGITPIDETGLSTPS